MIYIYCMTVERSPAKKIYEIFHAVKNNDGPALMQLYQDNYKAVERYILQNSGTADDAKDIYQEAFVAVWRNIQLDKFTPQHEGSLTAYILQISRNKWISHLRTSAIKNTLPLQFDATDTADEPTEEETDHIEMVAIHFKKLGDNCKELLSRFYYKKESLRSIGNSFSWTEATAKNNKYRCLEKLRKLLKNQE